MAPKNYIIIASICFFIGILLVALHKNYIIINNGTSLTRNQIAPVTTKQTVSFYYWNGQEFAQENLILILSDNALDTMQQIISHWLHILHNEKIIKKNVSLQTVLIDAHHKELFINLDRGPWNKESSTFEKWMIIESLLKTIKANTTAIKKIHLLQNHAALSDYHLDFSKAWPVQGFI